jgi:uncharacterized protein
LNLDASSPAVPPHPSRPFSIVRTAFIGPQGLRAGWRFFLYALFVLGVSAAIQTPLGAIPAVRNAYQQAQQGIVTPFLLFLLEGPRVFAAFLAAWIMSRIEKRSIQEYGLAIREAFGKLFWQGALWGFAECTALLLLIRAFGGFSFGTLALSGTELARYALLWALGFLFVAFFEEYTFRGYGQFTLTAGIGFWPAAIVLSILFGAIHLGNSGEALFGATMAGLFGLFGAFTVRRTGNLWFAVGEHAAFDYSETFIYSVPDSGQLAAGHLMNPRFHGQTWLTGGSVGPEGSIMILFMLLLSFILFNWLYPAKK